VIYEWDEAKRAANIAKHGVDFADASAFEWASALQRLDLRRDYGEARWQALGYIGEHLFLLVFTPRGDRTRIISLRRANSIERDYYAEESSLSPDA
jgi:uncharacterized protein